MPCYDCFVMPRNARTVRDAGKEYIYALKYKWLTPLYDPILRLALREQTFKKALVEQARIQPGQRVLDLGCGTGTLTLLIKGVHPQARVEGMDGNPKILSLAQAKAARAGLEVDWKQGPGAGAALRRRLL